LRSAFPAASQGGAETHPHPDPPLEDEGVVLSFIVFRCKVKKGILPPLQGEGWGGDGLKNTRSGSAEALQAKAEKEAKSV
jgi:hypothetical protein